MATSYEDIIKKHLSETTKTVEDKEPKIKSIRKKNKPITELKLKRPPQSQVHVNTSDMYEDRSPCINCPNQSICATELMACSAFYYYVMMNDIREIHETIPNGYWFIAIYESDHVLNV